MAAITSTTTRRAPSPTTARSAASTRRAPQTDAEAAARRRQEALRTSPLAPGAGAQPLLRFVAVERAGGADAGPVIASPHAGRLLARAPRQQQPSLHAAGHRGARPGDFAQTHVGDETDTSPYPDDALRGISTAAYIRNMSVLIRALDR